MEGSCQRNHLSFPRIMSEHTLTQLIGLLESKVLRSQRDPWKPFVPSYSQRSSRHVTGSLHVLHLRVVKMEELLRPREVQATEA
ncbi:cAMP-regulated phosphoprotein 19-related protein [Arabidopsis thaliana]|uniref:cAMP-regulated phosphoprotein 19-related protein n=1 Tax=Arabidopsis thaliana TaxID=3702 RepID=F4KC91_ARATH|nr:cAMP-regulated phosphoprotein 19-related protein [Arabidopsis thaliana]AED97844.1 cAMP-regulated phosphoprotein 19-related protein [Arabidopsis thaliana]|eukprot:NP_001032134.1 cAMP-regulated phosphoprotein 19-related protein [Arabidopsis thaliana]